MCNMPTSPFTHTDILKNPVLIESATWDTTQVPGDELASFSIPAVFASLDTFHTRMLQVYAYFKPTVCLRFIINSTKFHQGKLIAFYDPMESTSLAGTPSKRRPRNIYMATGQPNVILDAGYANTGIIEIPFEHVLSYMTTNSSERAPQMGTVYLMVLNSLSVSTGATPELEVQIMLSCSDVELHLPMRPHTLELLSVPLEQESNSEAIFNTVRSAKRPSAGIQGITQSITDSTAAGARFYGNLFTGNWNGVGQAFGDAWNATISGVKSTFQVFGMDKPSSPETRVTNMLATIAPLAHMKGVDNSVRLAATQVGGYTRMNFSAANPQEMSMKQIITTKMMFRQFDWGIGDDAGVSKLSIPVFPGLCNMTASVDHPGYTEMNPTFLSYMALAFEQWHGSINFRFDFTATQFHTGRILAVFEPNSSTTGATDDLSHYTNNPSHLFDLHENKTFEINIPFISSTPRKQSTNPTDTVSLNSLDESSIGRLSLYVYTPLAVSNNVPTTIPVNCYISAGDDFVFEIPRISESIYYPDFTNFVPIIPPLEQESLDALPLRSEDRKSPPSIIKGSGVTAIVNHYNEDTSDVRDFAKRFALCAGFSNTFTANPISPSISYTLVANELTLLPFDTTINYAQIPLHFVSALFAFYSGSLRHKFVPLLSRSQVLQASSAFLFGKVDTAPLAGTGGFSYLQGNGASYPVQIQNSSQDAAIEVETPYYSFYNQSIVNEVQTAGNFNDLIYGSGVLYTTFSTDKPTDFQNSTIQINQFVAAGDDFALRFLVSPPVVLTRTF
nr:MAG: polyprotein [Picornaviridae sp.]